MNRHQAKSIVWRKGKTCHHKRTKRDQKYKTATMAPHSHNARFASQFVSSPIDTPMTELDNVQMLSVIKFIWFTVDAFPAYSTDVHYASRGLVVCSAIMWFAPPVFIGMCDVIMDPTGWELCHNPPRVAVDKKRTLLAITSSARGGGARVEVGGGL
jgi:hypothetical protein